MAQNRPLEGKVIALTGGASGIGLATAHLLVDRGAKISVADVQQEPLNKLKAEIEAKHGDVVIVSVVDVQNWDQVEAWITSTIDKFGRLDGAANVAGVLPKDFGTRTVAEMKSDIWDLVIGVNLTGVMHCMRAQLRVIGSGGSVVNTASIAGLLGQRGAADYSASKHGVIGLTKAAAKEFGPKNIRVNAICPGHVETPMMLKARKSRDGSEAAPVALPHVALGREGKPEEIAKVIAFLLSDDAGYMSGAIVAIDGGWNC